MLTVVPDVVTGHAHGPPRSIDLPVVPEGVVLSPFHPTPMTDRFLTISEAEKFTGKSRSTLRRFIDGIAEGREATRPAPRAADAGGGECAQEAEPAVRLEDQRGAARRQFLEPEPEATPEAGKGSGEARGSDSSRLVTVLEKSIAMLERELAEKNSQIAAMNDRLRESNILMKDLQGRLALPAPHVRDVQDAWGSRTQAASKGPRFTDHGDAEETPLLAGSSEGESTRHTSYTACPSLTFFAGHADHRRTGREAATRARAIVAGGDEPAAVPVLLAAHQGPPGPSTSRRCAAAGSRTAARTSSSSACRATPTTSTRGRCRARRTSRS